MATAASPPARGRRRRLLRDVGIALVVLVALVAVIWNSPLVDHRKSVDDYKRKSGINGHAVLRIGVRTDQPLMGSKDEATGRFSGFDVEVARNLARLLGYSEDSNQVQFVPVEVSDRETYLLQNRVDLVVASYSITGPRKAFVRFAGPYLITTQEVLVRSEDRARITELADLKRPRRVCAPGGSTSESNLKGKGIFPDTPNSTQACLDGLLSGKYDAMSTDETVLAGYLFTHPGKLTEVNVPFNSPEVLGIGVSRDDPWLQGLINYFLSKSLEDAEAGRTSWWQSAYAQTLGRADLLSGASTQPVPQDVPDLVDHGDRVQGLARSERPVVARRRRRATTS